MTICKIPKYEIIDDTTINFILQFECKYDNKVDVFKEVGQAYINNDNGSTILSLLIINDEEELYALTNEVPIINFIQNPEKELLSKIVTLAHQTADFIEVPYYSHMDQTKELDELVELIIKNVSKMKENYDYKSFHTIIDHNIAESLFLSLSRKRSTLTPLSMNDVISKVKKYYEESFYNLSLNKNAEEEIRKYIKNNWFK